MMPSYTVSYSWSAHRQKRDRFTDRFTINPGSQVSIWLFGWVICYTGKSSKYPPETKPRFQPWRDALRRTQ